MTLRVLIDAAAIPGELVGAITVAKPNRLAGHYRVQDSVHGRFAGPQM